MDSIKQVHPIREQKEEGSIASIFTSFSASGAAAQVLPDRFTDLKKEIWKDSLTQSWKEILAALETAVDEISSQGGSVSLRDICKWQLAPKFHPADYSSSRLCRHCQWVIPRTD